jgi:TetR/AcrR family transcriptional regulator, transcriptional repressor for nem operon
MARPREFDESLALGAAVDCFWSHGFEATSIRDLSSRMGITPASLYNAFGDKRSIYERALKHYADRVVAERVAQIEAELPPRAAIERFFSDVVERSLSDRDHKGCMLVNSALELAPHDREFKRVVAAVLRKVEAFFRRCIDAGQRDGTIARRQSADDLSRLLLSALLGMRVLSRSRPERDLLKGIVRAILFLLDDRSKTRRSR